MKLYKKVLPLILLTGVVLAGCGAQHHVTHRSAESTQTRSMTPHQVKRDLQNNQNGAKQRDYQSKSQAKAGMQRQVNQQPQVANAVQAQKNRGSQASTASSASQEPGAIDLGHGITGHQDRGAGQTYVSFKMGRWQIVVHGNDVNEHASSAVDHAKRMVGYLQNHMLPVPSTQGIIQVDLTDDSSRISWDQNHKVNTLKGKPDVMLQKAVTLK